MNVSEFARRAGLSGSGVRWYESVGILPAPARRRNGYRDYTDADLGRLTLVLTLRRLGLKPEAAGAIARKCFEGGAIGRRLDYVITLSDSARESCPALPGPHSSLHWHLDNPASVAGPGDERMAAFRDTRAELSIRLPPFIEIARRAVGRPSIADGYSPKER